MPVIMDWEAKRSGPAMTVTGVDQAGQRVRITAVRIYSNRLGPVAVAGDGTAYTLKPKAA